MDIGGELLRKQPKAHIGGPQTPLIVPTDTGIGTVAETVKNIYFFFEKIKILKNKN